jgi:signal transduction histidine kinase
LVIALALSAWIARSVAKTLRAIAEATGRVASGDYDHRVPVTGPTEARVVGHAFNNMTAQVQFTQQAQQDFLANVSHDLRTPLTSIQGYSQAIIDGIASNPQTAKHAATIINEEAGRLNRMVNDLLDIAKIQAGRMQMTRQAVEVDQVLRLVGGSMAVKAEQKGVQLHTQIPDLTRIAGDGDRLAQVFTNLVDNAVKHTDSGGQVWFNAKLEDGGVLVLVQDTGEGIPQEDLSRIFERFYQVDKSRNRPSQKDGAGLGLAITHEIVHAHGGRIWVESEVGTGTRFSVWLPMMSGDRSTVIRMRL